MVSFPGWLETKTRWPRTFPGNIRNCSRRSRTHHGLKNAPSFLILLLLLLLLTLRGIKRVRFEIHTGTVPALGA
jgi:hypothetical protein